MHRRFSAVAHGVTTSAHRNVKLPTPEKLLEKYYYYYYYYYYTTTTTPTT